MTGQIRRLRISVMSIVFKNVCSKYHILFLLLLLLPILVLASVYLYALFSSLEMRHLPVLLDKKPLQSIRSERRSHLQLHESQFSDSRDSYHVIQVHPPEHIYECFPGVDTEGYDYGHLITKDKATLQQVCSMLPNCAGYNTNGWLKKNTRKHVSSNVDLCVKKQVSEKILLLNKDVPKTFDTLSLSEANQKTRQTELGKFLLSIARPLQIYSYDLPKEFKLPPLNDYKYATESRFVDFLRHSKYHTTDPTKATAFFVPVYCAEARFLRHDRSEGQVEANKLFLGIIKYVISEYPYWNTTKGADHFFVCGHDMGAAQRTYGAQVIPSIQNMIALVNTAALDEPDFRHHHDIALPPHVGDGCPTCIQGGHDVLVEHKHQLNSLLHPTSKENATVSQDVFMSHRPLLAFFAGNLDRGRIRPILYKQLKTENNMILINGYLNSSGYIENILKSKYCLLPRGHRAWSPRIMDAIWAGCVPVIISDDYVLPLTSWIDWSLLAVIIPETKVRDIRVTLEQDTRDMYHHRVSYLIHARDRLTWWPPKTYDSSINIMGAFDYVILELLLRIASLVK
eukprot:gene4179-6525_t